MILILLAKALGRGHPTSTGIVDRQLHPCGPAEHMGMKAGGLHLGFSVMKAPETDRMNARGLLEEEADDYL